MHWHVFLHIFVSLVFASSLQATVHASAHCWHVSDVHSFLWHAVTTAANTPINKSFFMVSHLLSYITYLIQAYKDKKINNVFEKIRFNGLTYL